TITPDNHGPAPWCSAAMIPGKASENALAASITPAPKPSIVSCARCEILRVKSAGSAPMAVAAAAALPPNKDSSTGDESKRTVDQYQTLQQKTQLMQARIRSRAVQWIRHSMRCLM